MIMFLLRALIFLLSAALGLVVADLILPDFTIGWHDWWGFVLCVVIFAILQSVLAPWIARMAKRYAPALLGGIGIVSTLIALLIVVLLPIGGLRITGALAWVLAPVIVWAVTALATLLLPMLLVKKKVRASRA
ncbi:phage holin family protein [Microbacterium horticulturae]|uniref:Phage holin family protein n=1 Tax=Microbacterium horticulturae TaxID=3028316 RepID=A0ABY8BVD3_9MICO|nr:phage holin family protein [Microbacterium sp. KACC 23027]WEG07797.1 phage holin family protein [Microbacterium sp. KACC 23027]